MPLASDSLRLPSPLIIGRMYLAFAREWRKRTRVKCLGPEQSFPPEGLASGFLTISKFFPEYNSFSRKTIDSMVSASIFYFS